MRGAVEMIGNAITEDLIAWANASPTHHRNRL
jgi:hypothetical protein